STLPDKPTPASSIFDPHSPTPAGRLTFGDRLHIYERSFISPLSIVAPALGAGFSQARNVPVEWGQGGMAYGGRFGSGYGREVIARTVTFGISAADGEDTRYFPLREGGFFERTKHAISGTLTSGTPSGRRMFGFSRFAGYYAAGFIANAWEPPSQNSA